MSSVKISIVTVIFLHILFISYLTFFGQTGYTCPIKCNFHGQLGKYCPSQVQAWSFKTKELWLSAATLGFRGLMVKVYTECLIYQQIF
jgi:hypothetical protein